MKRLTLLFALALSGSALCAQICASIDLEAGYGLRMMTLSKALNPLFDMKSSTSFSFGVGSSIMLNDRFYVQPGLRLVGKGGKWVGEESDTILINQKLHYLEFPLLLQVRLTPAERGFYAQAGGYIAMGYGGKFIENKKEYPVEFGSTSSDTHNRFDWGVLAGLGYFSTNQRMAHFYAGLQVGVGLNEVSIFDDNLSSFSKNLTIQLKVARTIIPLCDH